MYERTRHEKDSHWISTIFIFIYDFSSVYAPLSRTRINGRMAEGDTWLEESHPTKETDIPY